MKDKGLKFLIGCAMLSLGSVVLLGIGCFGLSHWLNSPGELLEPRQLLDPDARGHIEWRLELENPATAELVRTFLEMLARRSEAMVKSESSFMQAIETWNRTRQEEDFKRLFPSTASWTFYPGDSQEHGSHLFSLSIRAAANQLVFADWVLGLMAPRSQDFEIFDFRGETVLVFEQSAAEGPQKVYGFLHPKGIFVGTNQIALGYAIESLNSDAETATGGASALDELFAEIPEGFQMRGAIANDGQILGSIADSLFVGVPDFAGLGSSMQDVSSVTIGGAVDQLGDALLTFDFLGGSRALGTQLELAAQSATRNLAEHDVVLVSEIVERTTPAEGWRLQLTIEDLATVVEDFAQRSIDLERPTVEVEMPEPRARD